MGAVGGTVWHGIKGARNSPRGDRLVGSLSAIKARAPVVGGNFGVWGGLFSTFDCAVKGYRQKEDPYNAIISGFLTGGTLAVRSEQTRPAIYHHVDFAHIPSLSGGPKGMLGSAIGCGILLGVFEGVGVLVGRSVSPQSLLALVYPVDSMHVHRLFAETNKPVSPLLPEQSAPPPGAPQPQLA